MKQSGGFDARRLRPPGPAKWRWRGGMLLALLLILTALALAVSGSAALFGHPPMPSMAGTGAATVQLATALLAFGLGIKLWRTCRRRLHPTYDLCLSPHLLKKHD
ncbi:MAG TPA: hypothetical protein VJA19_06310 [Pseudomonas sp.]|nr:hypothetical protein [Pseudomonas sp.]